MGHCQTAPSFNRCVTSPMSPISGRGVRAGKNRKESLLWSSWRDLLDFRGHPDRPWSHRPWPDRAASLCLRLYTRHPVVRDGYSDMSRGSLFCTRDLTHFLINQTSYFLRLRWQPCGSLPSPAEHLGRKNSVISSEPP